MNAQVMPTGVRHAPAAARPGNILPLVEMLGVQWPAAAPAVGLAWDVGGDALAWALGDGQLACVDTRWPQGPRIVPQPGGGSVLVAAAKAAPAPRYQPGHGGSCLCIAAAPEGGWLSGGDDGKLRHSRPDGSASTLPTTRGSAWVDAVASSAGGWVAHAQLRQVTRQRAGQDGRDGDTAERLALPAPATALAFSPDGTCLAAAHGGGVTLWPAQGEARLLAWPGLHRALAWSPDGRYLVSAMQENALHGWRVHDGGDIELAGYPGQPLSMSFSYDGAFLATSGGPRPVCWDFDPPQGRPPLECASRGGGPVVQVACHPAQAVLAVGWHDGSVALCRPGRDDLLPIRRGSGGAVNALAWSPAGDRLAFGTQDAQIGWLPLPDSLFKRRPSAR